LLDVAHNPAAAVVLAHNLAAQPCAGQTIAVCGMFADKDSTGVIEALRSEINNWVVVGVSGARALAPAALAKKITDLGGTVTHVAQDVSSGCEFAQSQIQPEDRVVVFGSFYTVGPALEWISAHQLQSEKRSR
jgi:dihydrofolate synthase/folylpolyglutamate synthase